MTVMQESNFSVKKSLASWLCFFAGDKEVEGEVQREVAHEKVLSSGALRNKSDFAILSSQLGGSIFCEIFSSLESGFITVPPLDSGRRVFHSQNVDWALTFFVHSRIAEMSKTPAQRTLVSCRWPGP